MFHVKHYLKMYKYFIFFLCINFLWNCSSSNKFYRAMKNGDLIFVEAEQANLSGAISRVTNTQSDSISFDHVAIVETNGRKKFVLHSYPTNGSEKIPLKNFIKKYKEKQLNLVSYRLNDEYQNCIPNAIEKAESMLGKPYNFLYILNDNEYYCSDFVERAFRNCNIFELKPMTFINPKTGQIDEYWQNFYQSKKVEVPEGKLGCNPNGISKSKKIHKIATLKISQ